MRVKWFDDIAHSANRLALRRAVIRRNSDWRLLFWMAVTSLCILFIVPAGVAAVFLFPINSAAYVLVVCGSMGLLVLSTWRYSIAWIKMIRSVRETEPHMLKLVREE